ncbi:MAG: ECF transporter S component [Eubacteriales bacterium]|nr:ECF transporter S component [Eubacteriales bacterium]NCC81197.1 ECF transporter S component [Clostridia bacterium]
MNNTSITRKLTLTALISALVTVSTMIIQIPIPSGYIHGGDTIIIFAAVFFGPFYGAVAAGIGSMLADILSGYAVWAFPTLIVKSVMALIIGYIAYQGTEPVFNIRTYTGIIFGIIWMVLGYYILGGLIVDSFEIAFASIPFNIIQGIGGMIIFIPIGLALKGKIKF